MIGPMTCRVRSDGAAGRPASMENEGLVMLFRFMLWLCDISGKRRRQIEMAAVEDWKRTNLILERQTAIETWWANHRPREQRRAVADWSNGRPILRVEMQQGADDKWRCVVRDKEGNPIVVSAGFGFRDKERLRNLILNVDMVKMEFVDLPRKKRKANGAVIKEKEE